ncbi:MAG: hypothetical protein L0271_19385 [Gemmatimonadetes bacterium]|nr:hypothetical protein [Gemmatimonadota bacterium]
MVKGLFIALVLIGFAWGYPPTRARMAKALEPALVRLGPVGEAIVYPVEKYSTTQEIQFILDQIQLAKTEGKETPDEKTFHRWLSRRVLTKNNGADAWNFKYYLILVNRTITVGSVGKDGQRGTDDDIRRSIPF